MKGELQMQEISFSVIMKRLVRIIMVITFGAAGYQLGKIVLDQNWWPSITLIHPLSTVIVIILISALFGFIISPLFWFALRKLGHIIETKLQNTSVQDICISLAGLIVGLLVANLIALPVARLPGVGVYVAVLLDVTFGYIGLRFFSKRKADIWHLVTNLGDIRFKLPRKKKKGQGAGEDTGGISDLSDELDLSIPKILDTSSIIDGRILDVAQTGFLEGTLVLPRFVLAELQGVADSQDSLRRSRGRRGLSIVTELQKIESLNVEIPETTLKDLERNNVDEALVVLARRMSGKVVTTDYNLNQIAQIEGVAVLNVNDLANSLKPLLLPGENVQIEILRVGKENHQGVGYLDDGTMLVVEDGYRHIGEKVNVTVTSMLQTSAGRMVFGRIHP
jgi:uncharacterized protein YacL